ncbi:MAG: hypothetical protein AB7T38_18600 [Nitrospirales bacterium]
MPPLPSQDQPHKEKTVRVFGRPATDWILVGLVILALVLLLRKLQRESNFPVQGLAGSLPLLARYFKDQTASVPNKTDHDLLLHLQAVAVRHSMLTPSELWDVLKDRGLTFSSPSSMAMAVLPFGLKSQIGTQPGRRERRWYDLSGWLKYEKLT